MLNVINIFGHILIHFCVLTSLCFYVDLSLLEDDLVPLSAFSDFFVRGRDE